MGLAQAISSMGSALSLYSALAGQGCCSTLNCCLVRVGHIIKPSMLCYHWSWQ